MFIRIHVSFCEQVMNSITANNAEQQQKQQIQMTDSSRETIFLKTPSFGEIHIEQQGPKDGLPLFCMHGDGKGSSWKAYEPAMEPLAAHGYRVIVADMPGYGQTKGNRSSYRSNAVNLIREILDQLNLKSVVLLGRSVGGKSALLYANTDPKRVKKLVLTHPVIPPVNVIHSIKQPVLLTWAKDDHLGHPYAGPHGANYFVKNLSNCKLLSWKESDYSKENHQWEFYSSTYCDNVTKFLQEKSNKTI
jgi:predicted alpha/beta-fold hydrolase